MRFNSLKKLNILISLITLFFACFLLPASSHAAGGFPIIGVLHAGGAPEAIAADTQTHMVYIAYEYPGFVVGFDPISGQVRWRTTVGERVTDIQVDSASHYVYVVSTLFRQNQGVLAVLEGSSGHILFTTSTLFGDDALVIDAKRHRVYVASNANTPVDAFTLLPSLAGKFSVELSKLTFGGQPGALGVNSRLGRLYVGDEITNTVTVYDEDRGRVLATIPVADGPVEPLRVDETSGRVYVVCSMGQEMDVIDGYKNSVIAHIPVAPYPEGVAFSTATGRIYVADEGNKANSATDSGTTITVIDGQSFDVLGTLQVGRGPDGVEADPLLRRVYVSVEDSNAVVEISDAVDLPLQASVNFHQNAVSRQAISLLRQASIITLIIMFLTLAAATLGALSPRWHGRETLQTPPGGELSR